MTQPRHGFGSQCQSGREKVLFEGRYANGPAVLEEDFLVRREDLPAGVDRVMLVYVGWKSALEFLDKVEEADLGFTSGKIYFERERVQQLKDAIKEEIVKMLGLA